MSDKVVTNKNINEDSTAITEDGTKTTGTTTTTTSKQPKNYKDKRIKRGAIRGGNKDKNNNDEYERKKQKELENLAKQNEEHEDEMKQVQQPKSAGSSNKFNVEPKKHEYGANESAGAMLKVKLEEVAEGILLGLGNPILDMVKDLKRGHIEKYQIDVDTAILATNIHNQLFEDLFNGIYDNDDDHKKKNKKKKKSKLKLKMKMGNGNGKGEIDYNSDYSNNADDSSSGMISDNDNNSDDISDDDDDDDDDVSNNKVRFLAGGSAQNSLRIAQWMSPVPGITTIIGSVGNDAYGTKMRECVQRDGVLAWYHEYKSLPTGISAYVTHQGLHSIITDMGIAMQYDEDHIKSHSTQRLVKQAKFYYIPATFINTSLESIVIVAEHCVEYNKTIVINLIAPFLCEHFLEEFEIVLPFCDYIICNDEEVIAFGRARDWIPSDATHIVSGKGSLRDQDQEAQIIYEYLEKVAVKISSSPKSNGIRPRTVIITRGKRSTIACCEGILTEYPVTPIPRELLVDTNGAGDGFVGGFLAKLVMNKPLEECITAGHWAAKLVIGHIGCTFPKECMFEGL